jgi:hypothetical protein
MKPRNLFLTIMATGGFLASIFLWSLWFTIADGQTLCTPMGSSYYCAGPNQQSTITPFSRNQGVITTPDSVTPYTSIPSPRTAPAGIEPLRSLEPLPNLRDEPLSFGDTLPLPFSDPGGMLILGE